MERSIDWELSQVGHSSATLAVVVAPVSGSEETSAESKKEEKARKLTSVGDLDLLSAVTSSSVHRRLESDDVVRVRSVVAASSGV